MCHRAHAEGNDQGEKMHWKTDAGGGLQAVGRGGALTGDGAHILVIDDPIKNDLEALSKSMREKVWNWFLMTAYTRQQPGFGIVVIMTRWHKDDLAGRLLTRAAHEGWEVINLPAIADNDDIETDGTVNRRAGEALHPQRFPLEILEKIQKAT